MIEDSQNSVGFFKTELISNESLISGIPNFDFKLDQTDLFNDSELELSERLMLGKRAERYFSEWIKRSSEYELLAENVQIIEEKQTLGEFDFIVQRKRDSQMIHVELIYKFYLFDPTVDGLEIEKWVGPNRVDRLEFKLDKLTNHQFPLLHTKPAQTQLKMMGLDDPTIHQQVLFLANLFIPKSHEVEFNRVNKSAVEGTWMNLDEWKQQSSSDHTFAIPDKIDWFSRDLKTANWLTKNEALSKIKSLHDQKRSPLIWTKGTDGFQSRDFVVWW